MSHSEVDLTLFYYDLSIREIEMATLGQVKFVVVLRYPVGVQAEVQLRSRWRIPGAEIVSVWLVFRGEQYQLPLSTPHAIVFDYLCWNCSRGIGQSAAQIEAGLNEQLFYVYHASSAKRRDALLARASRTNVKKIVERLRTTMADLFIQEHLPLDPWLILRSNPTSSREIRYSIWADVSWQSGNSSEF